jgi:hypothetical protein
MYHLSTQYNKWLFTSEKLKELRTKANGDYVQKRVRKTNQIIIPIFVLCIKNRIPQIV